MAGRQGILTWKQYFAGFEPGGKLLVLLAAAYLVEVCMWFFVALAG